MEALTITPETLLDSAVKNGQSIESLKALMDLYNNWKSEKARSSFNVAMSIFQAKVAPIKRTLAVDYPSKNGTVKFKYAGLSEIITTIRPALSDAGLSVRWENESINNRLKVTCFVTHTDGHSECTSMEAEADTSGSKNPIQSLGSTLTYLQRYTVSMALGIVTEDDTDGQLPEKKAEHGKKVPTMKQLDEMKVRLATKLVTLDKIKEFFELTPEMEAELTESEGYGS